MKKKGFIKMTCIAPDLMERYGFKKNQKLYIRKTYETTDNKDVYEVFSGKGEKICSLIYGERGEYGITHDFEPISICRKSGCSWRIVRSAIGTFLSLGSLLASTVFKNCTSKRTKDTLFGISTGWLLGNIVSDLIEKHKSNKYANIKKFCADECPYEIDPYQDEEE